MQLKEELVPRKPRSYLPGVPCHIVQRGNNRQACFFCDDDFGYYIVVLADAIKQFDVTLHAYVLITNHVHLLMTPKDKVGISKVMQYVDRRYVRYINSVYKRTGTLWEGLIESDPFIAEQGSGAGITFNPDSVTGGKDVTGSNIRPPSVGLAHELGHAEAAINGTQPDPTNDLPGAKLPASELPAIRSENNL